MWLSEMKASFGLSTIFLSQDQQNKNKRELFLDTLDTFCFPKILTITAVYNSQNRAELIFQSFHLAFYCKRYFFQLSFYKNEKRILCGKSGAH